ncbi:alpha/beta hydrolase [Orrella sp. JC864]|uniref:alpha/beta fold hydrolase n=1 Tax=Orrella sp. JC864 TaxID=3120298 RepID=UPI00300A21E2
MHSEDSFKTSDGLTLRYAIDDFSPPWKTPETVVMLHAAMGSMERFYAWVPKLAARYRIVRWDMRGHGNSDQPPEHLPLSIERLAQDFVELMDALQLQSAHVVGSSTGGIIAMRAALEHPERFRTLSSYAAIPGLAPSTRHHDYNDWDNGLVREGVRDFMRRTIAQRFHLDQVEPGFVDWFIEDAARNDPRYLARFVRMMTTFDFSDRLREIPCPCFFVAVSGDPVHSMENYEVLKRVPDHRFKVYENMPHNITDAVPQRCVDDLLDFLKDHTQS